MNGDNRDQQIFPFEYTKPKRGWHTISQIHIKDTISQSKLAVKQCLYVHVIVILVFHFVWWSEISRKKKIIITFHSDNIIIPPLIFDLILKFIQQIDIILQTGTGHKCFNHTAARPADWTLFNLVPRVTTMCT